MRWQWLLALFFIFLFPGWSLGQDTQDANSNSTPSLADAAKKNKDAAKSKATRVFTDEDMVVRRGPIPTIALQGPDNTQQILDTIHEFRRTHDAAETEQIVHDWFDQETDILSSAIDANARLAEHNQLKMEAMQDRYAYGVRYDGDYSKWQQTQLSERWAQRSDARSARDYWQTISRIQQAFIRVRCDVILGRTKTAYDWFKIRTGNGAGSY